MSSQSQRAGRDSTNVQANTLVVYQGPSHAEMRDIALDVFRSNFLELSGVAAETAARRAEEVTQRIVERLMYEHPEGFKGAADPDMQVAIYTVQREYARTGDPDLAELLINVLVDRSKQPSRSLLQIVLGESLHVAPKLTTEQLATLSVIFTIRYTRSAPMAGFEGLRSYIDKNVAPFVPLLTKTNSCYQHLEYAGCGSIGIGSVAVPGILRDVYPGLFAAGFKLDEFNAAYPDLHVPDGILAIALRDADAIQLNAIDDDTFKRIASDKGIDEDEIDSVLKFERNSHMMSPPDVETWLKELHPAIEPLIDVWENSLLKNMTLTSVGIAIGHANARRITDDRADLAIWIS